MTGDGTPEISDFKLFTTYQIGEIIGVTANTVRRYIAIGAIRASKSPHAGGHYRISGKSLKQFIAECERREV